MPDSLAIHEATENARTADQAMRVIEAAELCLGFALTRTVAVDSTKAGCVGFNQWARYAPEFKAFIEDVVRWGRG